MPCSLARLNKPVSGYPLVSIAGLMQEGEIYNCLVNQDDKPDSGDKASQERPAKDTIQESKSDEASYERN